MRCLMMSPISGQSTNGTCLRGFKVTRRRHHDRISSRTPTIRTSALSIRVELTFRRFCTLRLIFTLFSTRLTRNNIFGLRSAITTTAIIRTRRSMTFIYRMSIPTTNVIRPTIHCRLNIQTTMCMSSNKVLLYQIRINELCRTMMRIYLTINNFSNTCFCTKRFGTFMKILNYRRYIFPLFFQINKRRFCSAKTDKQENVISRMDSRRAKSLYQIRTN